MLRPTLLFAVIASIVVIIAGLTMPTPAASNLMVSVAVLGTIVLTYYSSMPTWLKVLLMATAAVAGFFTIKGAFASGSLKAVILLIAVIAWLKRSRTLLTKEKQ